MLEASGPPPHVSVVTPVYNGQRYLAECIESVLAQTYPHWHYTIVDNASQDGSVEIARQYAARDSRIHVVSRREHVDVIRSHNAAFREVAPHSRYCKLVQADDWLFPECLKAMVALAEAHPSVSIVGAYRLDGAYVDLDGLPWPTSVIAGRVVCRLSLLGGPYVFGAPTSTLLRADHVRGRDPFYDVSSLHADEAVCYELLRHSDFGFVHQVLTYRRRHDQDGTVSAFARGLNTSVAGNLWILTRYGPVYLERHEYEHRLGERLTQYYDALGEAVLARREREFWDYHRAALATAGHPLRWSRVLVSALGQAMRLPVRALRARRAARRAAGADAAHTLAANARATAAAKAAEIARATPILRAVMDGHAHPGPRPAHR